MSISKMNRTLKLSCFLFAILFADYVVAQQVKPAPTFRLLDSGYGAAALGMGGAFTAVANDLSAIYWNPAGLAQLEAIEINVDWRFVGDSDEDFSAQTFPNRFESEQRYSLSGNKFQSVAGSYAYRSPKFTLVPAFAWQITSTLGPKRELKEPAGLVQFTNPTQLEFYQSQGTFFEEFSGGEQELAFGLGAGFSRSFLIGFTWNFLINGPEQTLTGEFDDTQVAPGFTARELITLNQSYKEDTSGNYFKIGALFKAKSFSAGGYVRTPYTRKADITLDRQGTVVTDQGTSNLSEQATAQSEIDIPTEWAGGIALSAKSTTVSGSVTYADWESTAEVISNSSNTALIPERIVPYPTLRLTAGHQTSLLQWRAGVEYATPQLRTGGGLALRAGIFWDGQPYGQVEGDRIYFKGYSFGLGYAARTFRIDAAYVDEDGSVQFSPEDSGPSSFQNRRYQLTATFLSP